MEYIFIIYIFDLMMLIFLYINSIKLSIVEVKINSDQQLRMRKSESKQTYAKRPKGYANF